MNRRGNALTRVFLGGKNKWKTDHKERYRTIRGKVLEILGGKCVHCGFSDPRALQIDHINNNGARERLYSDQHAIYRKILRMNKQKRETEYQLLCANCNSIKEFEVRKKK